MRAIVSLLAGTALVVTSGCAVIRDELRYPGGAAGRVLDERTFDTSRSKQLALLRSTLALAIAAQIGESTVSAEDADAFAEQLADATDQLNYAAVDAGYPSFVRVVGTTEASEQGGEASKSDDDGYYVRGRLCLVRPTTKQADPLEQLGGSLTTRLTENPYIQLDNECAGFYVNFESHLIRIEDRIVRAMLTSLPTDRARDFLDDLTSGSLLSALWSLIRSVGDIANSFRRGAGVYRSGIENFAATADNCHGDLSYDGSGDDDESYLQERDTVLKASACLGLSLDSLFDSDDIDGNELANRVPIEAFMALFRIARTSCVALPLQNAPTNIGKSDAGRSVRANTCERIRFNPTTRPMVIDVRQPGDEDEAAESGEQTDEEEASAQVGNVKILIKQ